MKIKNRLLFDAVMFILIWVCMEYKLTGGLIHEVIGIVLILGFLFHAFINRKYYVTMTRQLFSGEAIGHKMLLSYIVNVILLITALLMLVSSIAISKELFPFVGELVGAYFMWRIIHIISALIALACILVHSILHWKMILSFLAKYIKSNAIIRGLDLGYRVLAVVMAVLVLKISIDNVSGLAYTDYKRKTLPQGIYKESGENADREAIYDSEETGDDISSDEYIAEEAGDDINSDEYVAEDTQGEEQISLDDYLKKLNCNGCHRNCSLASPQCGRGRRQAQEAEEEYNDTYGSL